MGRHWRWVVVAVGTAVLAALPFAVRLLPAGTSSLSAPALLDRIQQSARVAYSGFAQSEGGLALPVDAGRISIGDLLGGTSNLRVWWQSSTHWRVDDITPTGEIDLHQAGQDVWSWNYESNTTEVTDEEGRPVVRVPRADDLVPANLARRLLSQATAAEVSRLANERVAGRQAAGLRLRVADQRSTVDHIDVWALASNGLPLRVTVYADNGSTVVSSTLQDLTLARPADANIRFDQPAGSRFASDRFGDVVGVINKFGRSIPPNSLAGLPRVRDPRLGAVGEYGQGVTQIVAIPLSSRFARSVVPQIQNAPGAVEDDFGVALGAGPVNLRLSPPSRFGSRWLLVGTVTAPTLRSAVPDLPAVRGFGFGR